MNKLVKSICIVLLIVIAAASCKEAIEPNLSNKGLDVLSPADGSTSYDPSITFWWNKLEGASKYRIQIVQNKFDSIPVLKTDTNVAGEQFVVSLIPGKYQWRIWGYNANSFSDTVTRSFKIIDSLALATIANLSPANHFVNIGKVINFSWTALPSADKYKIELADSASLGGTYNPPVIYTISSSYKDTFPAYGDYAWRLNAIKTSNNTQTQIQTWRYLSLLFAAPTSLTAKDSVVQKDSCKWLRPVDGISDSIYFYTNAQLSLLAHKEEIQSSPPYYLIDTLDLPRHKSYWWTVRSFATANKKSAIATAPKKFYTK